MSMYDHAKFIKALSIYPYRLDDKLKASRAALILDYAVKADPAISVQALAYCFATAFWESGWTLSPVKEEGLGRGHPYGEPNPQTGQIYYGRGLVQTTWLAGYQHVGELLKIDCVHHPDLLLQMQYAVPALVLGLEHGIYTGKKLSEFFYATHEDPYNARECVNSHDKAQEIAELYETIKKALIEATVKKSLFIAAKNLALKMGVL